jgi:aspartyl-tRNA(Asn)/glutamyl-tRNA(Gln) amidotransferase subunit A
VPSLPLDSAGVLCFGDMWSRRTFLEGTLQYGALSAMIRDAAQAESTQDVTRLSMKEAATLLRRKAVSPVELTQACLTRIERLNPVLNAFITITGEQALRQAGKAEAEIARGDWRGPLHGVPVALKDLFDTEGIRTTAASGIFKDRVPTADAEVVRRLNAAGAVLLGKLNMHEFAYGGTSTASYFGPVHNPWKLEYTSGGSSGGSGAAVAAELCYGALGSDTGGSIRQPAAYCGIAGLKPTYGRVSTQGVIPLAWSLDHVGPMCRAVADLAAMLQAIAGYDSQDTNSMNVPVPDYSQAARMKVSALRLGIPRAIFYEKLDPEVEAAVNNAIEVLRKLTASVQDVQLPAYQTLPITAAEAYAFHSSYLAKTPELYQPTTRQRLEGGAKVTAEAYIHARRELDRLRRSVREVFSGVDLLITPTTPIPAVTIAESANLEAPPPGGVQLSLRNTQPFDIYGLPAISVPCGFTGSGLPIGLQISGAHFGEQTVLALAHAYEEATDWHTRRPKGIG